MNKLSALFTASLLLTFLGSSYAIDIENAKERPCFKVTKTVPVDTDLPIQTWYYPLMSRLELYYTALEIAGKEASELQENELYYDGCMYFKMYGDSNDTVEEIGFGGRTSTVTVTVTNDTGIEACHIVTKSGKTATSYTTLTDNATFIFAVTCTENNQMTWGVSTFKKTLPKETVKLIHDHAESLGFKREFFTGLRYDYCDIP